MLLPKVVIKKLKPLEYQGVSGFWSKLRPHPGSTSHFRTKRKIGILLFILFRFGVW